MHFWSNSKTVKDKSYHKTLAGKQCMFCLRIIALHHLGLPDSYSINFVSHLRPGKRQFSRRDFVSCYSVQANFGMLPIETGRAVANWLRHYATNRQVAGSVPNGVIGIFQWHNPSGRTMALGSIQPVTEMRTKCISWGKDGRCVRLTTLPPSCAVVMKSGKLNFLEPSGPLQACNGSALTIH